MESDPVRSTLVRWVADLLRELTAIPTTVAPVRVTDTAGGVSCLVVLWPAGEVMRTSRARSVMGAGGQCRADVLAVLKAASRPLTRKEVVRALKDAGMSHGAGTVAKVLADLTAARVLLNPRDKRGYRLPG